MKVIDILNKPHKPFASFELLPPLKGSDINKLYSSIEPLMEFNPPFLNITAHRREVVFREVQNGSYVREMVTKRPGTVAIAAAIMKRFNTEVVPHVICGGASAFEIEDTLLDLRFLDIDNVMALRGDPMPGQKFFEPSPGGYSHSVDLVSQISDMNRGRYLESGVEDATPSNFCIGVAGYPQKHCEATNMEEDIANLKKKVDAGADYVVSQMFFDNTHYFSFVEKCRAAGINVPIIPGIKPISTLKQLDILPKSFSISLPVDLVKEVRKCRDNKAVRELGIEWATAQCKDLLAHGAEVIHFYTMDKSDNIREIIKRAF
ncbi:MAG: methylenetetrahydrofolate reductase [NAD(P)H] [Bacteroidales bacterium]|nr:methylenetetrahydrofolate reductase [NAD(P)H] [Candidatus Egerieousia equi]